MRGIASRNRHSRKREPRHRRSLTDRLSEGLAGARVLGRRIGDVWQQMRGRAVPGHWTNLFGVVTVASFVVVMVTGIALMFVYTPSSETISYAGAYAPLHGAAVSRAFASTMHITLEVPGGRLLRQAHHWSALMLPASIVVQLVVAFFTGGYRRPRRAMWVLLVLAFLAAVASGWSGYALPDDMLSGTGLRIVEGIVLGIPVVGTWLASALFGGAFPGRIIENLYPLHIVVFPAALVAVVTLRAVAAWRHGPLQFPGQGRTADRVVGAPLVPTAAVRAGGLFAVVTGLLLLVSATVTVSPIWLYGPSDPANAGAGSQPDWYTGFLDGALRLVPPGWELQWLGRTWTLAVLAPLAVVGAFFALLTLYPYIEERLTGDRRDHDLLDRPRAAPGRTGVGVAGLLFVGVLWTAGGADIIATTFSVSIEHVILTLQAALVVGPVVGFSVARRVALGLQQKDRMLLEHGYETGRILRLPGGEYVEVHRPLDEAERARIALPPASGARRIDARTVDGRKRKDILVGAGTGERGSAPAGPVSPR